MTDAPEVYTMIQNNVLKTQSKNNLPHLAENKKSDILPALTDGKESFLILVLISFSFFWTGSAYLTWLYRLPAFYPMAQVDLFSEVIGYLFQAVGLFFYAWNEKHFDFSMNPARRKHLFSILTIIGFLLAILACLSSLGPVALVFGFGMNLLFGMIAGCYLTILADCTQTNRIGILFGGGYAIGSILSWIFSLPGQDNFLTSPYIFIIYGIFAGTVILLSLTILLKTDTHQSTEKQTTSPRLIIQSSKKSEEPFISNVPSSRPAVSSHPTVPFGNRKVNSILIIAAITVLLLSCINSAGAYFPFQSAATGNISLELSRAFYAVGLIAAGLINDKKRAAGAVLCVAALCFPFFTIAAGPYRNVSELLRILGYIFFGFYAVYRVILFIDFSKMQRMLMLACLGLLCGRLGDALGALLGILFSSSAIFLVSVIAILFVVCIFLFFYLFQRLYMQQSGPTRDRTSEFALRYELSSREIELLQLVLDGKTNKEIAEALFISENTVKFHMRNLLKKTDCKKRGDVIKLFHEYEE